MGRMRRFLAYLLLLPVLSLADMSPLHAQPRTGKTLPVEIPEDDMEFEATTAPLGPESEPVMAERSSSAYLRQAKRWSLVAQPIGLFVWSVAGFGVSLGYYSRADLLFEIDYSKGEFDAYVLSVYGEQVVARLKKFWGNSFYTNLGAGTRMIGLRDNLAGISDTRTVLVDIQSTMFGMSGQIGNRWQYQYFTIGCDWLGVFFPITKVSEQTTLPGDASEAGKSKVRRVFDPLARLATPELLRLYIGVSW